MPNWHKVADRGQDVELRLRVHTNMNAGELGEMMDALCIALEQFGMEHISNERREYVHLSVLDPGGYRVIQ